MNWVTFYAESNEVEKFHLSSCQNSDKRFTISVRGHSIVLCVKRKVGTKVTGTLHESDNELFSTERMNA